MKVAVVYDWLDGWGGGERCLEQVLALFPRSELFTLVDFLPEPHRPRLHGRRIHTSFLQNLPHAATHFRRYLPLFPRAIESFDLSGFDLIVSCSHAVAKGVKTHARQLHICYCYTPMRYAWDMRDQYLQQVGLDRGFRGLLANRLLDRIRRWDQNVSRRVDSFVAISQFIAQRIQRCYGRSSEVVYPAVAAPRSPPEARERKVYVTVSRLVPYKRIDVIAKAFLDLPDRELVILGDGPQRTQIQSEAGPNVRMLGYVSDEERDRWLRSARGFLFAAEEDFGIAPVEAQAHGTPVISYAGGGASETVRGLNQCAPTGVFFPEQTPASVAQAVRVFEAHEDMITAEACRQNAARFSTARFRNEFLSLVDRAVSARAENRARSLPS